MRFNKKSLENCAFKGERLVYVSVSYNYVCLCDNPDESFQLLFAFRNNISSKLYTKRASVFMLKQTTKVSSVAVAHTLPAIFDGNIL